MRYIDVHWHHELHDEPYRLVSEIDCGHYETRKLEFFRSGEVGYANIETYTQKTMLSIVEIPDLRDINAQKDFQGEHISKQKFESLWLQYVNKTVKLDV